MLKKILCVVMSLLMLLTFATSCKKKEAEKGSSSKKPNKSSSIVVSDATSDEEESSSMAIAETESQEEEDTSSFPYKWTIKTKSAFFRDTEEAKTSATTSGGIKKYKYNGGLMLGAYHLSMQFCTASGTDTESRAQEFADVVKGGYFNTYLLPLTTNILTEAKLVAENGGTIWLAPGPFNSANGQSTVNSYKENIEYYYNLLKDNGYGDIVLGCHWDEPIWRTRIGQGMNNADYLAATEAVYKLGLRTFPCFTTNEFTDFEANQNIIDTGTDAGRKIKPESLKYTTDVGFDVYAIDVRDGADNAGKPQEWAQKIPGITDGKTMHTKLMETLIKHTGHDANVWYFTASYTCSIWGGLDGLSKADEDYCMALLDFLSADVMTQKYPGGVFVYSYNHGSGGNPEQSLREFLPIKDATGSYKYFPEVAKWSRYSTRLKEVRQLFDSKKATLSPYTAE